jgi:hypothetical protein
MPFKHSEWSSGIVHHLQLHNQQLCPSSKGEHETEYQVGGRNASQEKSSSRLPTGKKPNNQHIRENLSTVLNIEVCIDLFNLTLF